MHSFGSLKNIFSRIKKIYSSEKILKTNFVPEHRGKLFEVQMWIISDFILKKLIPVVGIRPFPLNELCLMVSAVYWIKPSHIFDWGTNIGLSARIFYETITYFGIRSEIHSVDLPDDHPHIEHPGNRRGQLVRHIKDIHLYQGDGATTALAIWDSSIQKNRPLFFLDGDHSYESVKRELNLIYEHIRNPNFLIHDTFFQSEESNYNVGPFLAIKDFLNRVPDQFLCVDTQLGLPGMTFLHKMETSNTEEFCDTDGLRK